MNVTPRMWQLIAIVEPRNHCVLFLHRDIPVEFAQVCRIYYRALSIAITRTVTSRHHFCICRFMDRGRDNLVKILLHSCRLYNPRASRSLVAAFTPLFRTIVNHNKGPLRLDFLSSSLTFIKTPARYVPHVVTISTNHWRKLPLIWVPWLPAKWRSRVTGSS